MVGCTELMCPWLSVIMTSVGFLMVMSPVESVYMHVLLAVTEIGILEVVYKGLIIITSKLVEGLLQTILVVSQLCVV